MAATDGEPLRFDEAIRTAMEWAKSRNDILMLVTADHETGGFGFSYSGSFLPKSRPRAGDVFQGKEFKPNFNFAAPAVLDKLYAQEKSFFQIFQEFDALPPSEQTPENLKSIVNSAMPFQISAADAVAILTNESNPQYQPDHKYLREKIVPLIHDFSEFYVFGKNARMNLLGRKLAAQQSTV